MRSERPPADAPRRVAAGVCVALLLTAASAAPAAGTAGRGCLPPLFDGGQRLHGLGKVEMQWLPPLLRQHELCWRDVPGEVRVVLLGNSAVYGFPLPVEASLGARLNARFAAAGTAAHLFNLGWVYTYLLKDALILQRALAYHPDVIVYAVTLADMVHLAPPPVEPLLAFMRANADTVAAMAAAPPPGLEEPLGLVGDWLAARSAWETVDTWRQRLASTVRGALRARAGALATALGAPAATRPATRRRAAYDCDAVTQRDALFYRQWQSWNLLEALAALRADGGPAVLVVNWPIAHEPRGACHNARYTAARVAEYRDWLRAATARLDLPYLDLGDLLTAEDFLDSLHVSPAGPQRIADRVGPALSPLLASRRAAAP